MRTREAIDAAAMSTEPEVHHAYLRAIATGATDTQLTAQDERTRSPLQLLALALARLPELCLYTHLFEALDDHPAAAELSPALIRAVHDVAAGTLRLAHRALEVHGGDNRYAIDVWLDRAHDQAALELALLATLTDLDKAALLDQARLATLALTRATAATADDRMLVPEELANGLAHILPIYIIALHASI
jgi:hypothetical protein